MLYGLWQMSTNSHIQDKLHMDILSVDINDTTLMEFDKKNLTSLQYLDAVFKETVRYVTPTFLY